MEKKIVEFIQLKKQVDFLMIQVTEKRVDDLNVYINNFCHLMNTYQKISAYFDSEDFRTFVAKKDMNIMTEIYTIGKVILGVLNFIKVMQYEGLAPRTKS